MSSWRTFLERGAWSGRFLSICLLATSVLGVGRVAGQAISEGGRQIELSSDNHTDAQYVSIVSSDSVSRVAHIELLRGSNVRPGELVTIWVSLSATDSSFQLAGFDLTIGFDSTWLELTDVTAGLPSSYCQWEYFTFRTGPVSVVSCDNDGCPTRMVRIIALAEINNGDHHPTCFANSRSLLASLWFHVSDDPGVGCRRLPLQFIWSNCDDNILKLNTGDTTLISNEVDQRASWGNQAHDAPLPSVFGAPSNCAVPGTLRAVNFSHATIDVLCSDSIDARGDLNLNGLSYEIADAVTFVNYFMIGMSVFSVNTHGQIEASDVNADGRPLTVADLEFLYRIMVGDATPFPRQPADSGSIAALIQDSSAHTISLDYADSLGAIYLIFSGKIDPVETMVGGLGIGSATDSGLTRVLISPSFQSDSPYIRLDYARHGLLFHYVGDGQLLSADATNDGTQVCRTAIRGSSGDCCRHRGNFDGWSDTQETVDIADLTGEIAYIFQTPAPVGASCWDEADANGDRSIDIADVSALVDYLFSGVPLPPCH